MSNTNSLRGFSTITYYADDHNTAVLWYTDLLGIQPYFKRDGYVEFRVGDYQAELGIIDAKYRKAGFSSTPGGAIMFWHVDDLQGMCERLLSMGAKEFEPVTDRGEGFVTASFVDPFGNILGIMHNPHYLEVLNTPQGELEKVTVSEEL